MPPDAWSPRRCRGACAVRAATLEPGPPNERSAAHPTRRVSPTFRQASRKSGRRSACMAARTHNAFVRPVHSKTDRERTHGQALFAREDLHADAPLHTFRRRSRRHAWAKPCLAGRPTMLVRTQPPEQNTSRSRPSGMELPDYPVVALTPTPQDQDGPAPHYPAGSFSRTRNSLFSRRSTFPVLATRSTSRRSTFPVLVPRYPLAGPGSNPDPASEPSTGPRLSKCVCAGETLPALLRRARRTR
jgi:hypothetical protein